MLINILRRLFGKWAVILSHKEYNALIKDYEYKRDFERTLSAMEHRLHSCDNANEILEETLRTACEFYQANWAGFLDISKDQTMWSPYIWYNTDAHDMTRELTDEFEPTATLPRWMTALNMDMPFSVSAAENVKESYPDEYQLYQRLRIQSVLAVPVTPRPLGFFVVRNPRRYNTPETSSAMRMFAFVMLSIINDKAAQKMQEMAWSPEDVKAPTDIYVKLFDYFELNSYKAHLSEENASYPAVARTLAYMILHREQHHKTYKLLTNLMPDSLDRGSEKAVKSLHNQMHRVRKALENISISNLIVNGNDGYYLSREFNIITDVDQFQAYFEAALSAQTSLTKIELFREAIDLYKGDIVPAAEDSDTVAVIHDYHMKYITAVNKLLALLAEYEEYSTIQHIAEKSLHIENGNPVPYYWLIVSYRRLGAASVADDFLKRGEEHLEPADYQELLDRLDGKIDSFTVENA